MILADTPQWLMDLANSAPAAEKRVAHPDIELDAPLDVWRFERYLDAVPNGIEGQGSDDAAIKLANKGFDSGLSPELCAEILFQRWGQRSGFDIEWVAEKVENAARYRQNDIGCDAWRPCHEVFAGALQHIEAETSAYPLPISAAEMSQREYALKAYVLKNFILANHLNLLYGDGGTGKTLLAEHIAVAVAAGIALFGLSTIQMPVLLVLAEDDHGETKARFEAICPMLGVNLADLPIRVWCLPGYDAHIASIADDGSWKPGPFLERLRGELQAIGAPCLLVLDTVSDIWTGDETKRLPVNTLCKIVLAGLCREFGATVLVNAHPSKAAMADGSGYAGSTAWKNAVRNLLTFERPKDARPDNPRRILKVAKANYGAECELELFQFGMTFATVPVAGQSEADERGSVLSVMLDLIDAGVNVVRANGSGQKPADVADEVRERNGLHLTPKRVLDHLNALERSGHLVYVAANKNQHTAAGFRRGPQCES